MTDATQQNIAFQGQAGSYHEMVCRATYPNMCPMACHSFEAVFRAVQESEARLAVIAVENTLAGRVADVHHLMPEAGLHIVGEYFLPIRHALLGIKGAKTETLEHVHSHVHALPQCRQLIEKLRLTRHVKADTAGAAAFVADQNDPTHAAIAAPIAAAIYGLDVLQEDIQDSENNVTRFLILSRTPETPPYRPEDPVLTSCVFKVRNIPAALYKALGGFATNGVNMTKLESYVDEHFQAAQFYCDVEGHP
ncbi:MAG: prephenate dehydratase, partial [Alphaproteobacteria bacterium]|nr:prephenate dehydratase [Alphaproteobacteria bacterium]